jgi:hypothetical protein
MQITIKRLNIQDEEKKVKMFKVFQKSLPFRPMSMVTLIATGLKETRDISVYCKVDRPFLFQVAECSARTFRLY